MPPFPKSRSLYEIRERPSRTYSWHVFILSNVIAELPSQTFLAVITLVSWYYPVGMYRTAIEVNELNAQGGLVFLIPWSHMIFVSSFSQLVMSVMPDVATAVNIGNLLFLLSLIFSG